MPTAAAERRPSKWHVPHIARVLSPPLGCTHQRFTMRIEGANDGIAEPDPTDAIGPVILGLHVFVPDPAVDAI